MVVYIFITTLIGKFTIQKDVIKHINISFLILFVISYPTKFVNVMVSATLWRFCRQVWF